MRIKFSKYSGCGNDFIVIDNRESIFPEGHPEIVRYFCRRSLGIGADGVILLERGSEFPYRMRIFNSDGHEAEMCGNGIRCLMKFIHELNHQQTSCTIETHLRPLAVAMSGDHVTVEMGLPYDVQYHIPVTIDQITYTVHAINTGVPHIVLLSDDVKGFDLLRLGPKFRHHPKFAPYGANFNVVQRLSNDELLNRTFERGVENETLACGTGCTAAAIVVNQLFDVTTPIKVHTRSGEILEIFLTLDEKKIQSVHMTGPAQKVFVGEVDMMLKFSALV